MMPVIILFNVLQTNLEKFLKFYFWKKKKNVSIWIDVWIDFKTNKSDNKSSIKVFVSYNLCLNKQLLQFTSSVQNWCFYNIWQYFHRKAKTGGRRWCL